MSVQETKHEDDFFANEETVTSDLPRYAINDDPDDDSITCIDAYYEGTQLEVVDGKQRLLHRVRPVRPDVGHKRILLWGNYQLDAVLPTLDPGKEGAKVRISYKGKKAIKGGRTLKQIEIIFVANAKRRENSYIKTLLPEE
jgi:hypothetical protein